MKLIPTVIGLLLIVILAFYFFPNQTRDTFNGIGHAISTGAKKTADYVQGNEKINNEIDNISENLSDELGFAKNNSSKD